jgi:hypothetical protein
MNKMKLNNQNERLQSKINKGAGYELNNKNRFKAKQK